MACRGNYTTSAIWKMTYLACETTFAPILMSFSRSVVGDQCFALGGSASRRYQSDGFARFRLNQYTCHPRSGLRRQADNPPLPEGPTHDPR